jgi:plasmid stabilization system protein ParE
MAFRVEISPQAVDDLDAIAGFIKENSSFDIAEDWFNGIIEDIASLREMAARCPVAIESEEIGQEVRVLLHGGRVLFRPGHLWSEPDWGGNAHRDPGRLGAPGGVGHLCRRLHDGGSSYE